MTSETKTNPFPSFTETWHKSSYASISPLLPTHSLQGKTILLTGGGSGIGLAIAKSIVLAGASDLFLIGRRASVLSSAAASLSSLPGISKTTIHTIPCDVSDKTQVESAFGTISSLLSGKKLDVLISNAGFFTSRRPIGTESVEEWTTNFSINLLGVYLIVSAFLAHASPNAVIINISTAITHLPATYFPGFASYASTKMAGTILMKYVQAENPTIRVIDIHPGQVTDTDLAGKLGEEREKIDDAGLAGDFVVWALSEEAGFLKGRFVWVNWDVDELKARREEILKSQVLTMGLEGFASFK